MKKIIVISLLILINNAFAEYAYESPQQSHDESQQLQSNSNLNSDYNSSTSNPSNYHRSEGAGLTLVN